MSKYTKYILLLCLTAMLTIVSCEQSSINSSSAGYEISSHDFNTGALSNDQQSRLDAASNIKDINSVLAAQGRNIRLAYAETVGLSGGEAQAVGQTIYANDREKQLTAQWAPGDTRRNADGNNLTYLVDETSSLANGSIDSEPAIDASFDTWTNVKKNSKLNIVKVADPGIEPSIFFGGNPLLADISEIGFLPGIFFEIIVGPGSSTNVLGVTFTFIWVDDITGEPTDINNDGFEDVALKEVWYNDDFLWTTDPDGAGVDIETVALHENGHALGFGHFGKISVTNNNNKLHVSPRAVMNAIVLGTQRDLLGTDKASYNSIYGNWPK